ncbi:helix-turn-helix domain-containing protein [Bradyrhizobium sp. SEMIA]|uniref:helix-turn-helix domain-containing protein n=1 Tax=Bradyrhizobium sp. SEMIA TaxID=2597515 RepID=UPI002240CC44|nr:helix-turn-helix transcriptional regulator [Bradyrhizobium sp. SEMIA]
MPKRKRAAKGPTKIVVDHEREYGTRLRLARVAKNMSQEQLGSMFDLSFQQIQKYEKGTNRMAGSRIVQFSKALGTTPHQLLGWHETQSAAIIDAEVYKMAQVFMQIPALLRPLVLKLLNGIVELVK